MSHFLSRGSSSRPRDSRRSLLPVSRPLGINRYTLQIEIALTQ
jgi:hypothetical protein